MTSVSSVTAASTPRHRRVTAMCPPFDRRVTAARPPVGLPWNCRGTATWPPRSCLPQVQRLHAVLVGTFGESQLWYSSRLGAVTEADLEAERPRLEVVSSRVRRVNHSILHSRHG